MIRTSIVAAVLCASVATASAQYAPQPQPYYPAPPLQHFHDLSQRCRLASDYLKRNTCGPEGCEVLLCTALRYGCRINGWGYVCHRQE